MTDMIAGQLARCNFRFFSYRGQKRPVLVMRLCRSRSHDRCTSTVNLLSKQCTVNHFHLSLSAKFSRPNQIRYQKVCAGSENIIPKGNRISSDWEHGMEPLPFFWSETPLGSCYLPCWGNLFASISICKFLQEAIVVPWGTFRSVKGHGTRRKEELVLYYTLLFFTLKRLRGAYNHLTFPSP